MAGGLMQLVAYGAQDIYLTGNPMITYFKAIYRRHTNFSVESIQNTFETDPTFGSRVSALVARNGDLMSHVYIQAQLPDVAEKGLPDFGITDDGFNMPNRRYTRWIDNVGHYLIKTVDIEIGGQLIDRHYSDWLEIWAQLTVPASQMEGYRTMIGQDPYNVFGQNTGLQADVFRTSNNNPFTEPGNMPSYTRTAENILVGREIYIPLQFWFCRDYGMALPLIALQHHEVKINVEFSEAHELIMTHTAEQAGTSGEWVATSAEHSRLVDHAALDVSLWIDYIYLDTDERRKFAQVSHEYLIEQMQTASDIVESGTDARPQMNNVDLFFKHPVKELVWVCKGFENGREWCNYTNTQMNLKPPLSSVSINAESDGVFAVPQAGLAGLNNKRVSVDYDIDVVYQVGLGGGGQLPKGTELTVVSDDSLTTLTNASLYFNVNEVINFHIGDLVVLSDQDPLTADEDAKFVQLLVSATDSNHKPTTFVTMTPTTGLYTLYSFASTIDHTGGTGTVTVNGITDLTAGSTSQIITRSDLIDFASYNCTRPYNSTGLASNPVKFAKLQINNYDRIATRQGSYFNWYQCKRHHTNIPESPGINVYSFALKPEEQQPSGTCNFSRLERSRLILWIGSLYNGGSRGTAMPVGQSMRIYVYAKSYNVLRIMSGMAGLAYHS